MRSAMIYNFLIEANLMASIAILLMIPLRRFFRRQVGNTAICFGWLLVAAGRRGWPACGHDRLWLRFAGRMPGMTGCTL